MPEYLLKGLYRKLKWEKRYPGVEFEDIEYCKEYLDDCEKIKEENTYDDIPIEEKFKVWDLTIEESDILLIQEVVINVRKQLKELWDKNQVNIDKNRHLMGLM